MMKRVIMSLSIMVFLLGLTTVASAITVETKTKDLPIAGEVTFTSSFVGVEVGDTVTIEILDSPNDPDLEIQGVILRRCTPRGTAKISASGLPGRTVDVTLDEASGRVKTIHLKVTLSTDESLGVNLQIARDSMRQRKIRLHVH